MKTTLTLFLTTLVLMETFAQTGTNNQVKTANGIVQGLTEPSGIHVFRGIPYATPPVRENRWRPPQPVNNWNGIRMADRFANQCMQTRVFGDMAFRNAGISEDCLYLNVWTPQVSAGAGLPVLVYYYGGGFVAGDGSEPRYDGESMAKRGIVVVTMSYRLGVFGFMAHPELTAESPNKASGNYALMDQTQALRWVKENIAAFGGDPNKVTIAGESAGSVSVSAQMVTPLARGLFAGAIGESGSLLGTLSPVQLAESEKNGVAFASALGAKTLEQLRGLSATEILEASMRQGMPRFSLTIDGYFLPKSPVDIFTVGEQAHVPLLVGWNSEEMNYRFLLGSNEPTPENFVKVIREQYGERAADVLKVYPATTNEETVRSATDLAGDRFIGYSTWKWFDVHRQTGNSPVYRYYYAHPRPAMVPEMGDAAPGLAGGVVRGENAVRIPPATGAVHSAEIEYALGNLATNKVYAWTPDDQKVSDVMQRYFANFIKTGNPNAPGLPEWPVAPGGVDDEVRYMRIDVNSSAEVDRTRERYLLLEKLAR